MHQQFPNSQLARNPNLWNAFWASKGNAADFAGYTLDQRLAILKRDRPEGELTSTRSSVAQGLSIGAVAIGGLMVLALAAVGAASSSNGEAAPSTTPAATPTPPQASEQQKAEMEAKVRAAREEAARRAQFDANPTFALDLKDNFTQNMMMIGLTQDVFRRLDELHDAGKFGPLQKAEFVISAETVGQYQKTSKNCIMRLYFAGDDLRKAEWGSMTNWTVMNLCEPQPEMLAGIKLLQAYCKGGSAKALAPYFVARVEAAWPD